MFEAINDVNDIIVLIVLEYCRRLYPLGPKDSTRPLSSPDPKPHSGIGPSVPLRLYHGIACQICLENYQQVTPSTPPEGAPICNI